MNEIKKIMNPGRIAGLYYLLIILTGIFAELIVRSKIIVAGDASATSSNILEFEGLFKLGIVSDVIMILCYLALGVSLYYIFKKVNKKAAKIMLLLNLIGVPIMALNLLNQMAALMVLKDAAYLSVFSVDQLEALSLLFLNLQGQGYMIAAISFGPWLFPLGYLSYKSTFIPKVIGIFLMVAGPAILLSFILQYLFPGSASLIADIENIPSVLAEFSLCLFLLIKGVTISKIESV